MTPTLRGDIGNVWHDLCLSLSVVDNGDVWTTDDSASVSLFTFNDPNKRKSNYNISYVGVFQTISAYQVLIVLLIHWAFLKRIFTLHLMDGHQFYF